MDIEVLDRHSRKFFSNEEFDEVSALATASYDLVLNRNGVGSEFLGWETLPSDITIEEISDLILTAKKIQSLADVMIVLGVGGSHLGGASAIEMLSFGRKNKPTEVIFSGNNMSTSYYLSILEYCKDKEVVLNVVSKSGTTTETAMAFRIFRNFLKDKYGTLLKDRIYVTTDPKNNVLRIMAQKEGYKTFAIPSDIGGRYSVLTPVGLLPVAVAGFSIEEIIRGAAKAKKDFESDRNNSAVKYAALRNLFYKKGKTTEILVTNECCMNLFSKWQRQLFAESEGKDEKGILPTCVSFTSDLHSVGQYIQDGRKDLFETVLTIEKIPCELKVPFWADDGLSFLNDRRVSDVNQNAVKAAIIAHEDGGVPVIEIKIPELSPFWFGYTAYFFECACAVSAYTLGVNPFDQPAVEKYKRNMFALLGKEGYEDLNKSLSEMLI